MANFITTPPPPRSGGPNILASRTHAALFGRLRNLAFEVWHHCAEYYKFDRFYRPLVV